MFKVMVFGKGGREFALVKGLLASALVQVLAVPGLSGMLRFLTEEERSRVTLRPEIKDSDVQSMLQLALEFMPDLVVIGPEEQLFLGLSDLLREKGFRVLGFSKKAAELERDKLFCKRAWESCGLPTAPAIPVCSSDHIEGVIKRLRKQGIPVVLKCNGPALGKGVIIVPLDHPDYWDEVERQLRLMMDKAGPLGFVAEVVLLETHYAQLREWSAMHLLGPNDIDVPLMPTKDHKRALDGDQGLNTGGMGIVTPAPGFSMLNMEMRREPVRLLRELMRKSHLTELCGILYEGLNRMLGEDYLVEINARGGDPETQGQLQFVAGLDLYELLLAIVEGNSEIVSRLVVPLNKVLVGVVMASNGYPEKYAKGTEIWIPDNLPAPGQIFPAGLVWEGGHLFTAGGRVLMVTGEGSDLAQARDYAYANVDSIKHGGALVWRTDIGRS